MWPAPLQIYVGTVGALLLGAFVFHLVLRMAGPDGRLAREVARAPLVDVLLFYFTGAPQVVGPILGGWAGLGAAVGGQVSAMLLWIVGHELWHLKTTRGRPRIFRTISRNAGGWRNHVGVWWTTLAVPAFWIIRFAQVVVYGPLTVTARLPRQRHADYVSLSRHKFEGLVGYDLIWCLYCDWMTGVWSLAGEMLRNVESFWCPIRFADAAKCEKCVVDFPDIDGGWVPADGTLEDVTRVIDEKYGHGVRAWFGHPVRLTVSATPQMQDDEEKDSPRQPSIHSGSS
ncbi:MAG: hypothetical protein ACYTGP_09640 [Planctomycetota bacterium]|jgi:hypothetical protein